MKFEAAQIARLAEETTFPADNLEKVLRLRELLNELHRHSFLKEKLVLKGGTALNLFYLDLARLSVDIDLNYIAQIDREAALKERPQIEEALENVAKGIGYKLQRGVDAHALREWHLGYTNHANRQDHVQVEINFLMRACALLPRVLSAAKLPETPPCEFLVLATEEVFGGKVKAMIDRRHPRDLYDLFRFAKAKPSHDAEILRKLAVLFASTMDHDFRSYGPDRFAKMDSPDIERLLYPLLRAGDRPSAAEMLQAATPLLSAVLDHSRENEYLEAMAKGDYRPELLFPKNPEIANRIRQHPALLWKAQNLAEHHTRLKNRS